jgi:hypothetical protein
MSMKQLNCVNNVINKNPLANFWFRQEGSWYELIPILFYTT